MADTIEIVTDKKQISSLVAKSLYDDSLEEALPIYKQQLPSHRKHWTARDLDVYIRKTVSTTIVDNEFRVKKEVVNGREVRKKTKREVVMDLATSLNLPPMAIQHVYNDLEQHMKFDSSKKNAKDFISVQIYNQIDELDLLIASAESSKEKADYIRVKKDYLDSLAKVENIQEKAQTNMLSVGGDINTSTTIDKQLNISKQTEDKAMIDLINRLLPSGKPQD